MFFTAWDIETTGFSKDTADVVQFSYILYDETGRIYQHKKLHFWQESFNDGWTHSAYEVHHLSKDFLRQFENEFETNCKIMSVVLSRALSVTFNGDNFDYPFIRKWLERYNMIIPDIDMSFDVYKYAKDAGIRCKLSELPDRIGMNIAMVEKLSESIFEEASTWHNSDFDTTVTYLGFQYLQNKGVIEVASLLRTISVDSFVKLEVSDTKKLGAMFNIKRTNGKEYHVALCPDPNEYMMFIDTGIDANVVGIFEEVGADSNIYKYGNYILKVTNNTVTVGVE